MMSNLSGMLKQMQEASQRMEELEGRLSRERIEAAAAGGLVKVAVSGLGEVLEVTIDGGQLGLDAARSKQLQDSVFAAVRGALKAAAERKAAASQDLIGEMTGGLDLGQLGLT